jgi:hypothetical protein
MKILDLRDNALFLQNWRERMRLPSRLSGMILTVIITGLIFLSAYLNPPRIYPDHGGGPREIFWLNSVFWSIAVFQGVILLVFGTLAADKMALRERMSGTLDFHRSSPTRRINQYLGLLLGAPSLEWFLFLGTFIVSACLWPFTTIPLKAFLHFYPAMILCAILYHSCAILFSVSVPRRGFLGQHRLGGFAFLLVLYIMTSVFYYSMSLSIFFHLSWLPAYDQLSSVIFGRNNAYNDLWDTDRLKAVYSLFTVSLPPLALQTIALLPALIFTAIGVCRKISFPERQILSKTQLSIFMATILFLVVGSIYSSVFYHTLPYLYDSSPIKEILPFYVWLCLVLGAIQAFLTTPTRLQFLKGLQKTKKLGLKQIPIDDDYSSNISAIAAFAFIAVVMSGILNALIPGDLVRKVISLILVLAYVGTLAGVLEGFRLSPHYKKQMFLWTGLGIAWFLLPILAEILKGSSPETCLYYALRAFSPFWGAGLIVDILTENTSRPFCGTSSPGIHYMALTLYINLAAAIVAQILAAKERKNLCGQIFRKP